MSGGAVASSDGNLQVAVPAGAISGNVTITVAPAEAPAAGAVGSVYEIGPSGTQFAMPVTLTLHYASASLGGTSESSLRVATFAQGSWHLLPGAIVDTQAKTVSGVTTHLSPYAIVAEANGKTCATVRMDSTCTTGGGNAAGGGSTGSCTAPTCAGASNVCGAYPGATMDGCSDNATGFTATCCFPTDGPICFAAGSTTHCGGSTGTGNGAGSGGAPICPAAPTCADATTTACAAYPGATLQNCVDGADGYTGSCCFAPQTPVCVSTGAARSCGGSTTGGSTTCPPAPGCADADPCGSYAGATTQSCTDGTDGFQATCCFALGTLPQASGGSSNSGGTDPAGGRDAGTGTGGVDAGSSAPPDGGPNPGNGSCVQGTACPLGSAGCVSSSPTSCIQCACGKDGVLSCGPCGATGGPDSGAGACVAGGACQPGQACGGGDATSCTQCMCGVDGFFSCSPCSGGKLDGGATGGPDSGVGACVAGGACQPGQACGGSDATGCTQCMCGVDGFFSCSPCSGGKPDGGASPPPDGGGGSTTCQINSMPPTSPGAPCGVMEMCSDGSTYRVQCDGTTSQCMCWTMGVSTGKMPSVSCTGFDPKAALIACGFPAGP